VPSTVRTWVAAVIAAVLLIGGGVGGYFIGDASDHDRDRPGIGRDHRPGGPGGPGFRDRTPNGPDRPDRPNT
jgi:hypothetical protein